MKVNYNIFYSLQDRICYSTLENTFNHIKTKFWIFTLKYFKILTLDLTSLLDWVDSVILNS